MIFLIDKSVENFAYFSQLTPYTAKYPNVKERTTKEMIELVLTFLQEEAVNLNCRIKVTGKCDCLLSQRRLYLQSLSASQ